MSLVMRAIVIGGVVVLGIGGFFGWQSWQSQQHRVVTQALVVEMSDTCRLKHVVIGLKRKIESATDQMPCAQAWEKKRGTPAYKDHQVETRSTLTLAYELPGATTPMTSQLVHTGLGESAVFRQGDAVEISYDPSYPKVIELITASKDAAQ
ncbi:MAG: hypothetical protein MRY63_14250 [Neomegalonema sp.]|nr:hypothetical protein [Neomegalonema sp.]